MRSRREYRPTCSRCLMRGHCHARRPQDQHAMLTPTTSLTGLKGGDSPANSALTLAFRWFAIAVLWRLSAVALSFGVDGLAAQAPKRSALLFCAAANATEQSASFFSFPFSAETCAAGESF